MGVNLLGKIKIHEIAKELGLTSKQIIEKANSLGIEVSSHLSSVDEKQAKSIKDSFKGSQNNESKPESKSRDSKTDKSSKNKTDKKNVTPVIIRREVIINDEPKKVEEKPKTNRNDVGFVERNKNQDYNIVYRNKTTKPMTFSELFGIKDNKKEKNETKKTETVKKVEETKQTSEVKVNNDEKKSKPIEENKNTQKDIEIQEKEAEEKNIAS